MAFWAGLIGGAYRARSQNIDNEVLVNLYPELTQSASNAKRATLIGTPGLKFNCTATGDGCRGSFSQDSARFTVVGIYVYAWDVTNGTTTLLGTVLNDGKRVSFASNGRGGEQVALVAGGSIYIITLTTMTLSAAVAGPWTNALSLVAFMNGYFIVQEVNQVRRWFSALEDGTSWDALDFFATSQASDNGVGMVVKNDRLWCFGSRTSTIYYDRGDADNPFVPYPGSVMQEGGISAFGSFVLGDSIGWLSQDANGSRRILMAVQSSPQPISEPAIEFALGQMATVDDCEVDTYTQEGHAFACFTFPTGDQTWCYDLKTGEWHQRSWWNDETGTEHRWRARGLCQVDGLIACGDWETGDLYTLDLDTYTDNGDVLRWVRRAPYISTDNQFIFLHTLEIGTEAGVGLVDGQGSDPEIMLRVSWDSGHTYGPTVASSFGPRGDFTRRAVWDGLGSGFADQLVVEISGTDPVKRVIGPGAWLRVTAGNGLR